MDIPKLNKLIFNKPVIRDSLNSLSNINLSERATATFGDIKSLRSTNCNDLLFNEINDFNKKFKNNTESLNNNIKNDNIVVNFQTNINNLDNTKL
jgi:hypothetical protein